MAHTLALISLLLALPLLVYSIRSRIMADNRTRRTFTSLVLISLALVIGGMPRALKIDNDAISITASLVSMALTVSGAYPLIRMRRA